MNLPADNSYIGITTPYVREALDFYVYHFGYARIANTDKFASVMAPNKKRSLGFTAPDDARSSTPPSGIHLVFLVENAATALAEFRHRGIPITRDLTIGSWTPGISWSRDPAGVEIFISERAQQAESEFHTAPISATGPDHRSARI
jgi:predicted enzyme related to lactoylglutathione lyase